MAPLETNYPSTTSSSGGTARLGGSLHVKGEITGNEDLHVDGSVEGLIQLEDRKLTVGASAKVTADIIAREVVVYGNVKGNLLDAFNMALLLTHSDEAYSRRRRLYERAAENIGWQLLSMLVQIAGDGSDDAMLREIFAQLLKMLDRKLCGERWMARASAATYVLKDKITILLPLVLECLDGEKSSPVASPEAPGGSMLAPHPRITPQAASSLASSFAALDDWEEAGRPGLAIPVLTRGLQRWKLRSPPLSSRIVQEFAGACSTDGATAPRGLDRNVTSMVLGGHGDTDAVKIALLYGLPVMRVLWDSPDVATTFADLP